MKKPLIVLLSDLHPEYSLGGGQNIAYEYFELMIKSGLNAEFWYTKPHKEKKRNNQTKYEIQIYSPPISNNLRFKIKHLIGGIELIKFIWLIIRKKPANIWIHQIGNHWPMILIPILRLWRIHTIVTLHDFSVLSRYKIQPISSSCITISKLKDLKLTFYQRIRFYVFRFCVNNSTVCVALSDLQKNILSSFGVRISYLIPNGVSTCNHDYKSITNQQRYTRNILFAGRANLKGLDILVQSINQSNFPWILHLAGSSDLLTYVKKMGVTNYKYYGIITRDEVSELIHQMDLVFACSQCFDVYPTICLEALRHKTPFITTNISGTSQIYSSKIASNLIFNVGTVPDLDMVFDYISQNYYEIINEEKKILDTSEVYFKYLRLLKL
jgi:glycosyltransferase involved in cell wall biosynthesis